jgi:hypothetical protein
MEEDDVRQIMEDEGFEVVEVDGSDGSICCWVALGKKDKEWAVLAIKYDADASVYDELARLRKEDPDNADPYRTPDPEFVTCQVHELDTFKSERQARKAFAAASAKVS